MNATVERIDLDDNQEISAALAEGDRKPLARFLESNTMKNFLRRIVYINGVHRDDMPDLTQEIIARAWEKMDANVSDPKNWIGTIAWNLVRDYADQRKRRAQLVPMHVEKEDAEERAMNFVPADVNLEERLNAKKLVKLIEELAHGDEILEEVFVVYSLETNGYTPEEIRTMLGVGKDALTSRRRKFREKILDRLCNEGILEDRSTGTGDRRRYRYVLA